MAAQPTVSDYAEKDLGKMAPAEFYASAKHQAVRRSLGIGDEPCVVPPWQWVPNDEWRKLEGIFGGFVDQDTTEWKNAERAMERAHDERKFGPDTTR